MLEEDYSPLRFLLLAASVSFPQVSQRNIPYPRIYERHRNLEGYGSIESFRTELSLAKSTILEATPAGEPPAFGVGLMGWQLDHPNDNSSVPRTALRDALESHVASIWLSFGSSLGDWVQYIRSRDKDVVITVLVNSVDEALKAANEWKVDLLVAQGAYMPAYFLGHSYGIYRCLIPHSS